MESFASIIIIFLSALFPLLLWGYGSVFLSEHIWNRARFLAGGIGGSLSAGVIYLFREKLLSEGWIQVGIFVGIIITLTVFSWIVTSFGSLYIRGFLRKVLLLHTFLILIFMLLGAILSQYLHGVGFFLSILSGLAFFLMAASLEESLKHLSSVGLTAKNFRFTRTDFLLFSFFVTLGFVSIENILYLIRAFDGGVLEVLLTSIYRLALALPLHVLAASVCVIFWWKALSYKLYSFSYVGYFLFGYLLAVIIHFSYNYLVSEGYVLPVLAGSFFSYIMFTQWITSEKKDSV